MGRMGRKKQIEPDDKEQSARFIEAAERVGDDEAEKRFEDAVRQISSEKVQKNHKLSNG